MPARPAGFCTRCGAAVGALLENRPDGGDGGCGTGGVRRCCTDRSSRNLNSAPAAEFRTDNPGRCPRSATLHRPPCAPALPCTSVHAVGKSILKRPGCTACHSAFPARKRIQNLSPVCSRKVRGLSVQAPVSKGVAVRSPRHHTPAPDRALLCHSVAGSGVRCSSPSAWLSGPFGGWRASALRCRSPSVPACGQTASRVRRGTTRRPTVTRYNAWVFHARQGCVQLY